MSRVEQRNLAILVAVVGGLLAGVAVLANYSGILRADTQDQPEVTCAGEGKVCTHAEAEAAGFPNVFASVDGAPAGGCCPTDKPAGACEKAAGACQMSAGGCGEAPVGCCEEPPAGCCETPPVGCCEKPQGPGCCPAQGEGATE